MRYFISMVCSVLLLCNLLIPVNGQTRQVNSELEAYSYLGLVDEEGVPFDGSNCYLLHLEKEQLPPVEGFWTLALFSNKTFLFVSNPLNRYWIGDITDGLLYNQDGSLDIYIQHDWPNNGISNWLPAPRTEFLLVLRLYKPSPEVINGQYFFPYIKKIN
jgi:hypothetical protein